MMPGISYSKIKYKNLKWRNKPIIIQKPSCKRCLKEIDLGFNFDNSIYCFDCFHLYNINLSIGNIANYILKRTLNIKNYKIEFPLKNCII